MSEIPKLGKITPYDFQWESGQNTLDHIRKQLSGEIEPTPAYINAYVSAGKTVIAGIVANHCQKVGARLLILARTGELVEQDSEEVFNMGGDCSVFSASLDRKSTHYSTVVGTEGTVANHLNMEYGLVADKKNPTKWVPHIILIDECHQVDWDDVIKNGDKCYSKILNHLKSLNKKLVIVGMTGSPYRGVESIKGPFWQYVILPEIGRTFLVDNGYIVPTIFGVPDQDAGYDLSEFDDIEECGTKDFSNTDMEAMHDKMSIELTKTIMNDVIRIAKGRLCVLITCAGEKHCKEAVSSLPNDEYAIITINTGKKNRQQILRDAKNGKLNERGTFRYKYIAQIGCLTTGVNVPLWDVSVLLRRIGSLTLLTQLLGRGMRLLKDEHKKANHEKHDHLVLDYSGTMASMHEMFNDPLLEDADLQKSKESGDPIICPICDTENGEHARRCKGEGKDEKDGRCTYFWKSRTCDDHMVNGMLKNKGCGAENDIAARYCRICDNTLIDPNAKLSHKSYGLHDWKPVKKMDISVTGKSSDAINVKYYLDVFDENGMQEVASVNYWAINSGGKRTWKSGFVGRHINGHPYQMKIMSMTAPQVINNGAMFDVPTFITHRLNEKGNSVVHGLQFNSGKTLKGSNRVDE